MTKSTSSSRFPYLSIKVKIGSEKNIEQELEIEALVDTGFNGGLALPKSSINSSITPDNDMTWQLADETEILTPAYLGSVQIGNLKSVNTTIIALGDEPILGTSVTNHFKLIFDHGAKIIVEP